MSSLERDVFKFFGLIITGAVLLGVLRPDRARGGAGLISAAVGGVRDTAKIFVA